MLPQNNPDRIRIAFDDHRLVANAACSAGHPRLAPGPANSSLGPPGRANRRDKMPRWSLRASWHDCIDDADALRAGRPVFSVAQSRRHPPWGPSCAAFAGATSVNSTA